MERSVETLQNKWKNIKAKAKQQNPPLIRHALQKTGGGSLKPAEHRIVESTLHSDIVAKLGIAAEGNPPRFDSDASSNVVVPPPTERLRRLVSIDSQSMDSDVNMGSQLSLASASASQAENSGSGNSGPSPAKRSRTATPLEEHYMELSATNELHKKYLNIQIERAELGKERETMQKRLLEIQIETAEEVKRIEIDKHKKLAELEIAAKSRDLNLN